MMWKHEFTTARIFRVCIIYRRPSVGRRHLRCLGGYAGGLPCAHRRFSASSPIENGVVDDPADKVDPQVLSRAAEEILACKASGDWGRAINILDSLGAKQDILCLSAAISVCGHAKHWAKAVELFESMESRGIEPSPPSFNALITAFGHVGKWENALDVLKSMGAQGVQPNSISYAAAIHACGLQGKWEEAINLLDESCLVEPSLTSFNSAVQACNNAEQYQKALEIFDSVEQHGMIRDDASYNIALWGVMRSRNWKVARALLSSMGALGIKASSSALTQGFRACKKNGDWEVALELLAIVDCSRKDGYVRDNFNSVLAACETAGQWEASLEVLNSMDSRGVKPNWISLKTAIACCAKIGHVDKAIELVETMEARYGISPDARTVELAYAACEKVGRPDKALGILRSLENRGLHVPWKAWDSNSA